jgi:HD-GYP domain-containing protein (c-di-GMP phosphodiesterase class II)
MRLLATRRFKVGSKLGRDVPAKAGEAPLLRAGVELTDAHRESLIKAGINAVYVDDDLGADIEVMQAVTEKTRNEARQALDQAFKEVPAMVANGSAIAAERMRELTDVASRIAEDVSAVGEAALALSDLAAADDYTMEHSIDVTLTGLLVARHMWETRGRIDWRGERTYDRFDQHMTQLGIGLFLHDIGKLAVPRDILYKPGKLEPEEWELVKAHPLVGLQMVKSDAIWPRAKDVIRSHHERWNGTGYPRGIAGEDIQPFARIASVADVFDAVTSERPYAEAASQDVGVRVIREGAGTQFAPEVVEAFLEIVPPYPPGNEIELADGRVGVVVSCPPGQIDLPLVRVTHDGDGNELETTEDVYLTEHPELAPRQPVPA